MEFEKILELIHAVSDSNLTKFHLADGEWQLDMETNKQQQVKTVVVKESDGVQIAAAPVNEIAFTDDSQEDKDEKVTGNVVKSPLVGTFYRASSPDSEPFVKVGDTVKKGQVLAIVEAMKLMNEIESEFDGTVKEILVENEQMVEYGQALFVIELGDKDET